MYIANLFGYFNFNIDAFGSKSCVMMQESLSILSIFSVTYDSDLESLYFSHLVRSRGVSAVYNVFWKSMRRLISFNLDIYTFDSRSCLYFIFYVYYFAFDSRSQLLCCYRCCVFDAR